MCVQKRRGGGKYLGDIIDVKEYINIYNIYMATHS